MRCFVVETELGGKVGRGLPAQWLDVADRNSFVAVRNRLRAKQERFCADCERTTRLHFRNDSIRIFKNDSICSYS
jgi:hypothetical protein